jgi:DNA processing protein
MAGKPKAAKLSDEQRFDWLRLIRSENVGPRTFRALLNNCGSARAALEALPELARRGGAARPIRVASTDEIERELDMARKLGVRFVALGEPDYPPILRQIDSAPPVLALAGREEALQQPAVAIVGSRNASAAGLTFADRLARGLGRAGYVVVSGLARGIDQRVHAASLETGALGVLAGGHAKPYPSEAVPLIARMIEFGAVVSEMPIEWEPRGRDFPRRNRIVSGLALGDGCRRGRARLGVAHHRKIRARAEPSGVRGARLAPRSSRRRDERSPEAGRNDLRERRRCARRARADALERSLRLFGGGRRRQRAAVGRTVALSRRSGSEAAHRSGRGIRRPSRRLSAHRRGRRRAGADRRLLGPSPISLDELARAAEASTREVRVALMELELAGRVEFSGGDRVALRPA